MIIIRHRMRYAACVGLAIIVVLLFLLTSAGTATYQLERYFPLLLVINALVAFGLFIAVISLISRLVKRYRQRQFGSRMLASLVCTISIVTLVPSVLIYSISKHLISQAFNAGIDSRVELALDAGVSLSQDTLTRLQNDQIVTTRTIVDRLANVPASQIVDELRNMIDLTSHSDMLLVDSLGSVVASIASDSRSVDLVVSREDIHTAKLQGFSVTLEGDPLDSDPTINRLKIKTLLPVNHRTSNTELFLQLRQDIPDSVADNISSAVKGLRDYQQIIVTGEGLRTIYGWSLVVTLTLAMLCAIFGSGFADA